MEVSFGYLGVSLHGGVCVLVKEVRILRQLPSTNTFPDLPIARPALPSHPTPTPAFLSATSSSCSRACGKAEGNFTDDIDCFMAVRANTHSTAAGGSLPILMHLMFKFLVVMQASP